MPMPPHVFALAAGELRYAAFAPERRGGALEFREYQAVPLAESALGAGALKGGAGLDRGAIEDALARLLERGGGRIERASLVLPDAWARCLIVELGDLPDDEPQRGDVLRFRLKRLIPFRVEELRLAAASLAGGDDGGKGVHALVTFASEALVEALEQAFRKRGIRLGLVAGSTLSLLAALDRGERFSGLAAAALVQPEGFTLVFARDGEPVLWRQKGFTEGLADGDRARLLGAELRLTRTHLAERFEGASPAAVVVAAPREVLPFWRDVLAEGLSLEPL
ncbi:MAG: hypothetical protein KDB94_10270, partial [Acidobacteria bacterium]|nr:hypothetical protein [Acidobacteriota bacterium]